MYGEILKVQSPRGGSFFARHWHGDYSLPFSYWIVGVLGNIAVFALVGLIAFGLRSEGFNPYLLIAALAAMWSVAGVCQTFQSVGIWRSARRYRREKRAEHRLGLWGIAAQVAVVVGTLSLIAQLVQTGLPQLSEAWRMAFLGDPGIPDYSLRLMRGGEEAEIAGGFKYGLARDAARIFATAPGLKVVHLNSGGGRLGEAEKLGKLIRQRQLSTYTSASCSSACTVAFLAGRERWLKSGARLGFHHESFAGSENFEGMRKLLTEAGLQAGFVDRAVAPSFATMWYPTPAELMQAHVVSGIVDNYRFAASGYGTRPDARTFEEQLRRTPLFDAIEATDPQAFRTVVDMFHHSYIEGVPEGRIMDDLRTSKVTPLILSRMIYADDQLLADYAALMADQYEALGQRDATACFRYAASGAITNLVDLLPDRLKAREMALSEAVLRSTERRKPTDVPVQPIYRTIFDKLAAQFGPAQVRILADPAKVSPAQYATYCNLAVAMFRTVAALPPEQAGIVMSHIFGNTARGK